MKVLLTNRRAGKTTSAIKCLVENKSRVLITFSITEAHRLQHTYPYVAERIVPWERIEFIKGLATRPATRPDTKPKQLFKTRRKK